MAVKCDKISMGGEMWTEVGSLLSTRYGHRSIVIGDSIMHIGGYGYNGDSIKHIGGYGN